MILMVCLKALQSVAEGADDVVYCVIKRTINGNIKKIYRTYGNKRFQNQRDSFFVDCGATYNGTNTNNSNTVTISGGTNYTKGKPLQNCLTTSYFKHHLVLLIKMMQ